MYLCSGKFNISPFSYQAAPWLLDILNFHLVLLFSRDKSGVQMPHLSFVLCDKMLKPFTEKKNYLKKKIGKNLEQWFLASTVGCSTKEKFLYHRIKNMEVTKCSQMTQALCKPFEGIVFEGVI